MNTRDVFSVPGDPERKPKPFPEPRGWPFKTSRRPEEKANDLTPEDTTPTPDDQEQH